MSLNDRMHRRLENQDVCYDVRFHPMTFTARATASAAHVLPEAFAKVVLLRSGTGPLVAVVPASRHVDVPALAEIAGRGPLGLAPEADCAALFPDCELGAMPPFGNLYGLPVFVDRCLARSRQIAFEAASHTETVKMAYPEFERLVRPVRGEFCR